jgi:hypothetical protein
MVVSCRVVRFRRDPRGRRAESDMVAPCRTGRPGRPGRGSGASTDALQGSDESGNLLGHTLLPRINSHLDEGKAVEGEAGRVR